MPPLHQAPIGVLGLLAVINDLKEAVIMLGGLLAPPQAFAAKAF
jgi:hypothetical protein